MFSGIYTHSFKNEPTREQIITALNKVGFCQESHGNYSLIPFESNFTFNSRALVSIVEYESEFLLQVQYSFSPTMISWILALCFFPFWVSSILPPIKG
jgi:hypothetical protein